MRPRALEPDYDPLRPADLYDGQHQPYADDPQYRERERHVQHRGAATCPGFERQRHGSPSQRNHSAGAIRQRDGDAGREPPRAGSYEGFLVITGAGPTLRVPYQYLVTDGVPADVFPLFNGGFVGGVGDKGWELDLRLVDQFGIPVTKQPVRFDLPSGTSFFQCNGGNCVDGATANYGNAAALVNLAPDPGVYTFTATAGGLRMLFNGFVYRYPGNSSQWRGQCRIPAGGRRPGARFLHLDLRE